IHNLTVLDEGSKAFSKPVYPFAYRKIQFFAHIYRAAVLLDMSHGFERAARNALRTAVEINRPLRPLLHSDAQITALQLGVIVILRNLDVIAAAACEFEMRTVIYRTSKMHQLHADDAWKRGVELNRQQLAVDRIGTTLN